MRRRLAWFRSANLLGLLVGALVATTLFFARPAQATNWGGPKDSGAACNDLNSSQCVAENASHTVNYASTLTSLWVAAMNSTTTYYDANSVMTITTYAPYGPTNDVRAATISQSNGLWGWTRCASTPASTGSLPGTPPPYALGMKWCKPQLLYFNDTYASNYSTPIKKTAIACHEFGHTMGLRHRSTTPLGCMRNPPIDSAGTPYPSPQPHDLSYLDLLYN